MGANVACALILGVHALAVFFLSTFLAIALARLHVMDAARSRTLQAVLYEHLFAPWLVAVLIEEVSLDLHSHPQARNVSHPPVAARVAAGP